MKNSDNIYFLIGKGFSLLGAILSGVLSLLPLFVLFRTPLFGNDFFIALIFFIGFGAAYSLCSIFYRIINKALKQEFPRG